MSKFQEYVRQIVKKAYEHVGFEVNVEDTLDVKMNRNILMTIACTFDIEDCREKSRDVLEKLSVNLIGKDPFNFNKSFLY